MASWERGYGDFEMKPDFDTLRLDPVAAGHRADASPTSVGTTARPSSRRRGRSCAASSTGSPSAGSRPSRPPSSSSSSSRRPTRRPRTATTATSSRPTSTTSTTRSSAPRGVEPLIRRIRNEMAGAGLHGRRLQGRVQPRPARDQLRVRARAAAPPTSTRSTRTAPRRSPTRRACRSPSWPSSTSARARRATSTCRCSRTASRCSPTTRRRSTASWPASSPACAS